MTVTQSTTSQVTATSSVQKVRAASAYDTSTSQSVEQTDKLAQMQEKYKDVYSPIPETYSKADENLQQQKIYEAYPNYISGQDFLKIVNKYYEKSGAEPIRLGQKLTEAQVEEQKRAQEEASAKAFEEIGMTPKEYDTMITEVKKIEAKYPYNKLEAKGAKYSAEITRFTNAAVYEGLEAGKTVEEAKIYAANLSQRYMSYEGMETTLGYYDKSQSKFIRFTVTAPKAESIKPDFNSPINTIWDFRKYGIDGNWTQNNIYTNKNAMIAELEKKRDDYYFVLKNDSIVEKANSALDSSDQHLAQASHYKEWIINDYLPRNQFVLKIFKNYKIYDSVDLKI